MLSWIVQTGWSIGPRGLSAHREMPCRPVYQSRPVCGCVWLPQFFSLVCPKPFHSSALQLPPCKVQLGWAPGQTNKLGQRKKNHDGFSLPTRAGQYTSLHINSHKMTLQWKVTILYILYHWLFFCFILFYYFLRSLFIPCPLGLGHRSSKQK